MLLRRCRTSLIRIESCSWGKRASHGHRQNSQTAEIEQVVASSDQNLHLSFHYSCCFFSHSLMLEPIFCRLDLPVGTDMPLLVLYPPSPRRWLGCQSGSTTGNSSCCYGDLWAGEATDASQAESRATRKERSNQN